MEILSFCSQRRYQDVISICADLNYDVLDTVNVDERGVPFGQLLRELGLSCTKPNGPTWSNTRGSQSRIDYTCSSRFPLSLLRMIEFILGQMKSLGPTIVQ